MDDLINEFLEETNESLDALDLDFVTLEKTPDNMEIIGNIFRVMHTIKGTCGFLGLSRLEKVAHAAENIMDKLRDGDFRANTGVISLILEANDRIKAIIEVIEETEAEPEGDDAEIIERLNLCADSGGNTDGKSAAPTPAVASEVSSSITTPDLDGDIDFTPVQADYVQSDVASDITTPDLDGDIDFTPVQADYAQEDTPAVPAVEEIATVSKEVKKEAITTGLEVSKEAGEGTKKKAPASQSIRVSLDVLENLMQMVGELVLTRNQLLQMMRGRPDDNGEFNTPLQRLNHITSELQEGVMQTRMQPIGNAWAKFPRLIRDLANDLDKKIELQMIGAETDLDRQMLEAIKDPLTHMVRNSADHGIETPAERIAAGKKEVGTVSLSAYHEGGHIVIKIADDGKGLDVEKIKAKALESGLVADAQELEAMSNKQIYQFIYSAGFSTADSVTAVSGRGVGMDVVVSNIEKTGGHVEVNSSAGKGSEFLIKLPLTLAIMPVLIIESCNETFAIPQIRVSEIVRTDHNNESETSGHKIETINGSSVLRLRGRLLPLVSLSQTLQMSRENLYNNDNQEDDDQETTASKSKQSPVEPFIVVCEVGSRNFGILVDKVFHTEEIVVKPNSKIVSELEVYSGCTILGDGSVIMILDPSGIIKTSGINEIADENIDKNNERQGNADNQIVSFLTFKTWDKSPRAIPLELVSRLEEIDVNAIEWSAGQMVVQYRDKLMRLVLLNQNAELPESGTIEVIVFSDEGRVMGLVVEEIIDIVRQEMEIKSMSSEDGIMGSLIIKDVTTDLIDISYYFAKTFNDWLAQAEATEGTGEAKKRILLVDDSPFFRKFMQPVLTVSGFDVTAVGSALEALKLLSDSGNIYDVIVTDIEMPEMNGIEFAAKCSKIDRLVGVPIVALTSHTKSELGEDINEIGFAGFVSKSDRDQLVAEISKLLTEKQTEAA